MLHRISLAQIRLFKFYCFIENLFTGFDSNQNISDFINVKYFYLCSN